MTYTKRILTALATGAVLLQAVAPIALADTTLTITGNGADSHSSANLSNSSNTTVVQNNTATVNNNVQTNVSTGGNRASDNTGGNVVVDTGNAKSTVSLTTVANSNTANVSGCAACNGGNATVNISGNGSDSHNHVNLDNSSNTGVYQSNDANVNNTVNTDANTGNNDANRNTGGNVTVYTGNATSNVDVTNALNANVANVGGNSNSGAGADIKVVGNGSDSRNSVNLDNTPSTLITQDNGAYVNNDVNSHLKTGNNDANDNTGGNVTVDTGNANSHVGVDTMANFNAASADCGCMMTGVDAKIGDNGSDSSNKIAADLGGDFSVFQGSRDAGNDAVVNNNVDPRLDSGRNDANRNTGAGYNDPVYVVTGNSNSDTSVSNELNKNVVGQGSAIELPGGTQVSLNFDLSALLNSIHFSL
jgi:hypothetical protein